MGLELVKRNLGLVYGGANVGLMAEIANTVLANGGEVIGVMPRVLVDREIAHTGLTELKMVESMHERKALMMASADGFVAMPGGWGTLEELFEALTWAQLGLHKKPCGILNINHFYDHLVAFLEHAMSQGLVRPENHKRLLMATTPSELLDLMTEF